MIEYKLDPTNLLKKKFDEKYKEHSQNILKRCLREFSENFNNPILELIKYLEKFSSEI